MQTFTEVPVWPLLGLGERQAGEIPTYTALFRADARLEPVLDIALQSYREHQDGKPLTVLSVGSSYGAEVDTVLAYATQCAPDLGKISLIGVDINPRAIQQAEYGKYIASQALVRTSEGWVVKLDLAEYLYMFDVVHDPEDVTKYSIDSTGLRSQHDVHFLRADLSRDAVELPQADLILCNNLLFHLSPEKAEQLVWGMTKHLAAGGVMSFGANPRQGLMNSNSYDAADYSAWRIHMAEKLANTGIDPVLYDVRRKVPFVFQRAR